MFCFLHSTVSDMLCYAMHATFYMHQTSGVCAGMCTCDRMHQMKKTAIVSQRERNALTCFNEKVQINNVKMKTFIYLSTCLPAPISNCDQHKPNKFVMAILNSLHKPHGFSI